MSKKKQLQNKDTYKAILVQLNTRVIAEIELKKGNLKDIYNALGPGVTTFQQIPGCNKQEDFVLCDEEGWFKEVTHVCLYKEVYPAPIAGNILIVGIDHKGEDIDCTSTVQQIKDVVKMYTYQEAIQSISGFEHYVAQFK